MNSSSTVMRSKLTADNRRRRPDNPISDTNMASSSGEGPTPAERRRGEPLADPPVPRGVGVRPVRQVRDIAGAEQLPSVEEVQVGVAPCSPPYDLGQRLAHRGHR